MEVSLILLGLMAVVGAVLYLHHRFSSHDAPAADAAPAAEDPADGECCGRHAVCERDSLLAAMQQEPEYFDDEELDRFRGREADSYTPAEIEEFRDVLLTLRPDDVAPWARSIQVRGLTLPIPVRDELLMLVDELRRQS